MTNANWALGSPYTSNGDYGSALNWDPHVVPNEVAAFGQSNMRIVSITSAATVGTWVVGGYLPYTFLSSANFSFNGDGILGGGGSLFVNSNIMYFNNWASAGNIVFSNTNTITFTGHSTAGYAAFDNRDYIHFVGSSTAGNAHISVANTGLVAFMEGSTAGAANLVAVAEGGQYGRVVFGGDGPLHNHKLTAGSFSGNGIFELGENEVTVGNAADTTVSGRIVGGSGGRLVKVGNGIMTLAGVNTYGGGTAVNDGQLIVNGTIGKVSVGSADDFGLLFGNGTVGATTVTRGQFSAGHAIHEAGRLNTGNLDLQRGGLFVVDVAGIASPGAVSGYDQINVTGKVKLAGLISTSVFTPPGPLPRHTITIINNDGKDKVSGVFSSGTLYGGLNEGDAFLAGENAIYSVSYKGGTGNDVVLRSEGHFSRGTDSGEKINASTAPGGNEARATKFADFLVGRGGNDTIASGAGNDTIYGGEGKDVIDGGAGKDYVSFEDAGKGVQVTLNGAKPATVKVGGQASDKISNVENVGGSYSKDKLTGDSKDNILLGNGGKDTLKGGAGNDALVGGDGKDVLEGGSGKDRFVFNRFADSTAADTVTDFHHGQDKIVLDLTRFAAIGDKLSSGEFYAKAGAKSARDADDHIIYNKSNGKLYYDDDGKGGHTAVLFATLSGHPGLTAADFTVVTGHLDFV